MCRFPRCPLAMTSDRCEGGMSLARINTEKVSAAAQGRRQTYEVAAAQDHRQTVVVS